MKLQYSNSHISLHISKGLLCVILMLSSLMGFATTRTSVASGNWNNAAVWSPAGVPTTADNISINANHTITVSADANTHHLIINNNAVLKINAGKRLTISGNTQVLGLFSTNKGMVTLTSPGLNFVIGSTGTVIWDPSINTEAEATLFTRGNESFDPNSTLIIKNWYNYTVPIGSVVNGNFGNLEINSIGGQNSIVEWNQENYFESHRIKGTLTIDTGWITLDKTGAINSTYIGALVLKNVNSTFYAHNGTHPTTFTLTLGSVTNNGGTFYGLNDGNGNVNVYVTGNFTNSGNVKIINNSGVSNTANGNASLNVDGIFSQSTGDTRVLYNIATTNSGLMNATIGDLNLTGGIWMGQTACHTAAGTGSLTILRNLSINFQSPADKFRGTSLTSISSSVNNLKFNLTVNGNVSISGISSAEFTSSASQGEENIKIYGNLTIAGCTENINYGTLTASHPATIMVRGSVSVNSGYLYLSRNNGDLNASLGSISINGGTMSLKNGSGSASVIVNGRYTQNNGMFYFHNNSGTSSVDELHMYVNGSFNQSGGNLMFDDYPSQTICKATLHLLGDSCSLSGNGSISNAGAGNNQALATIKYDKIGTISYSRTGSSHILDQTIQRIEAGCTVSVNDCKFVIASHNQAGITMLSVDNGGILKLNKGQIASNERFGFTKVVVDSGATVSTQNIQGWYNGTTTAALSHSSGLVFDLNSYSTIEYCATQRQIVTGIINNNSPNQNKYGILRINIQGDSTANGVINSNRVFARTKLELIRGGLALNGNPITIENGNPSAIKRDRGYIISEGNSPQTCGTVIWKNITAGEHQFPFGISPSAFIPVLVRPISGIGSSISISTRATDKDNLPYPDQNISFPGGNTYANEQVLDRWWSFAAPGVKADVTIFYCGSENTLSQIYKTSKLNIVQWASNGWNSVGSPVTGVTSGIGYLKLASTPLNSSWTAVLSSTDSQVKITATLEPGLVLVKWNNSEEENVSYYEIEKSSDGINFSTLARKQVLTNALNDYSYDDIDLPVSATYYRVKMVCHDGSIRYSKHAAIDPTSVSLASKLEITNFGPNPFTDNFKFACLSPQDQNLILTIWTVDGKLAFTKQLEARRGSQEFEVPEVSTLSSGSYILHLSGGNQNTTKNIIKN